MSIQPVNIDCWPHEGHVPRTVPRHRMPSAWPNVTPRRTLTLRRALAAGGGSRACSRDDGDGVEVVDGGVERDVAMTGGVHRIRAAVGVAHEVALVHEVAAQRDVVDLEVWRELGEPA